MSLVVVIAAGISAKQNAEYVSVGSVVIHACSVVVATVSSIEIGILLKIRIISTLHDRPEDIDVISPAVVHVTVGTERIDAANLMVKV